MSIRETTRLKDTVRQYVVDSFLAEGEITTIQDDDDLMNMLDSLQIVRMVADLGREYSIDIALDDLTPENFGSVEKIVAYVARKQ